MSDEDHDVDIESDEDDDNASATQFMTQAEKRAHHNALERKRRDHIKESFHSLRDSVPALTAEKQQASRAQILKQATDYISFMGKKNSSHQHDIEDLKKQNGHLEQQVRALERAKAAGKFISIHSQDGSSNSSSSQGVAGYPQQSESEASSGSEEDEDEDDEQHVPRRKKLKT